MTVKEGEGMIVDPNDRYDDAKWVPTVTVYHGANKGDDSQPCPNCKEVVDVCACMRNKCRRCGNPVGNITFTVCDECWDILYPKTQKLTQPCPECEKHKKAVEKLIATFPCVFCPIINECKGQQPQCHVRLAKWAYEEETP